MDNGNNKKGNSSNAFQQKATDDFKKKAKESIKKGADQAAAMVIGVKPSTIIKVIKYSVIFIAIIIFLPILIYFFKGESSKAAAAAKTIFISNETEDAEENRSLNIEKDDDGNYIYSIFSTELLENLKDDGYDVDNLSNVEIFRAVMEYLDLKIDMDKLTDNGKYDEDEIIEMLMNFYAAELTTRKTRLEVSKSNVCSRWIFKSYKN